MVRHQFCPIPGPIDKMFHVKRFVRLEAKPYKASDSGFALTVRSIDFLVRFQEADEAGAGHGERMAQHGSQNGRAGLCYLSVKPDWPPSDHASHERRRRIWGEGLAGPGALAEAAARSRAAWAYLRSPCASSALATNQKRCSDFHRPWSRPACQHGWHVAFNPAFRIPDRCLSVTASWMQRPDALQRENVTKTVLIILPIVMQL